MKSLILFLGALCFSVAIYGQNLVTNGTFDGNPSFTAWTNNISEVTNQQTGGNPGGCAWLNHSGGSSDPSISQRISGLKVGETYIVKGEYVGGTNVHLHQRNVNASVFAIDIDGQAIKKLALPADMYKWTKFEATFVAQDSSQELRFRSEIDGTDGDVKLDNISVTSVNGSTAPTKSVVAFGWFNNTNSNDFTLNTDYQSNSEGGPLKGKKLGTGYFEVIIPGMSANFDGIAHATAYGGSHSAQIDRWTRSGNDLMVRVRTFAPDGSAIDGRFSLLYYKENQADKDAAYLWASNEGPANHNYKFNGKGDNINMKKTGTGAYEVRFTGMKADRSKEGSGGNVIVTPYSAQPLRAQVQSWLQSGNDLVVKINTFDASGNPADGRFSVSYNAAWSNKAAYLWADNSTSTTKYVPNATYSMNNGSSSNNEIVRRGPGQYAVSLPGLSSTKATVIATAYGNDKNYVTVTNWTRDTASGGTTVNVNVYGPDGQLKDGRFSLMYTTDK